jgi:hypothetical protein
MSTEQDNHPEAPEPDGALRVQLRLSEDAAALIDEWRKAQPDQPDRAEALLRLIEAGLASHGIDNLPSREKIAQILW